MTLNSRILALASGALLALSLAACAPAAESPAAETPAPTESSAATTTLAEGACADDTGVTLQVDATALEGGASREWCRTTDAQIAVADILDEAGVALEGTEEYGDQVVCRADGLPSADAPLGSSEDPDYIETCESMPAAFGYWSLWIRPADGDWGYAQEGVATQQALPGETVSLLFTLDGAPAAPTS